MRLIIRVWCMEHAPSALCPKQSFEGRDPGSIPGARIVLVFEVFLVLKLEKLVQKSVVYAGCSLRTQIGCGVRNTLLPLVGWKDGIEGRDPGSTPGARMGNSGEIFLASSWKS
jgi:hypothetical protein